MPGPCRQRNGVQGTVHLFKQGNIRPLCQTEPELGTCTQTEKAPSDILSLLGVTDAISGTHTEVHVQSRLIQKLQTLYVQVLVRLGA